MITLVRHPPGTVILPPRVSDSDLAQFLQDVEGTVEATRSEYGFLWEEFASRANWEWKERLTGLIHTLGKIGDLPVCISLRTAHVRNRKILFYHCTSRVVDHEMVETFRAEYLPGIPNTDATNFTNLFPN